MGRACARRRSRATARCVDDFAFSRTERALHVRNAPSPGATASLAIARHVADEAERARVGAAVADRRTVLRRRRALAACAAVALVAGVLVGASTGGDDGGERASAPRGEPVVPPAGAPPDERAAPDPSTGSRCASRSAS